MDSPCTIPRTFGFSLFLCPAQYICVVIHVRDFESQAQFADRSASVKISNSADNSVLQALKFQEVSVHRTPTWTDISHY
jgi:hypothetical protein